MKEQLVPEAPPPPYLPAKTQNTRQKDGAAVSGTGHRGRRAVGTERRGTRAEPRDRPAFYPGAFTAHEELWLRCAQEGEAVVSSYGNV